MVFKAFLKRFFRCFFNAPWKNTPGRGCVCASMCWLDPAAPSSFIFVWPGRVWVGWRRGLDFPSRRLPVARLSVFLPLASLSADPQRGGGQCPGLGAAPQRQPPGGARPTGGAEPPQLRTPVRERGLDPKGSVCALPPSMVTVFWWMKRGENGLSFASEYGVFFPRVHRPSCAQTGQE